MRSGTARQITRIALMSCITAVSALPLFMLYGWLADALSDPTVPITLIAVLLVTFTSLFRRNGR
jgi:MFS-type transporter involved in bile tolerance (Atg22 family)